VPLLGDPLLFVAIVAALILASVGFGLVISVIADSELQAVQLALLLLLASVFFAGFVTPADAIRADIRALTHALPVTNAVTPLHDVMLFGARTAGNELALLGATGVALVPLLTLLLRRAWST
jgi:ABC-2 type transport system permease protein